MEVLEQTKLELIDAINRFGDLCEIDYSYHTEDSLLEILVAHKKAVEVVIEEVDYIITVFGQDEELSEIYDEFCIVADELKQIMIHELNIRN